MSAICTYKPYDLLALIETCELLQKKAEVPATEIELRGYLTLSLCDGKMVVELAATKPKDNSFG